ncbi:GFA family protein [Sorangium sp. So ce542]|uniref:GFA family protein n=1 Tax=Sorangium sp. So ce542 TaxID=3133316 RepID=UPI003F5F2B54
MGQYRAMGDEPRAGFERVRSGSCACGAVRFQLRGEPVRVGLCHCTSCRKETGSVFMPYAVWPWSSFESTGETRCWEGRSFCTTCGSRLFSPREAEGEVEIKLGCLDDAPTDLAPSYEIWIKRREPWLPPLPGTAQHAEDPPWVTGAQSAQSAPGEPG